MSDCVWMAGYANGKLKQLEPVQYNWSFEAMLARMVKAGCTHIYVDNTFVFQTVKQRRHYLKDKAFCGRVQAMDAEGTPRAEIARALKVNVQVIVSVLKRGLA